MPPSSSAASSASSLLLSSTSPLAPAPYTLLPPSPHLLPLRTAISFWSSPPAHHISAITSTSPFPSPPTPTPLLLYTGSTSGHLVQWEPLPSRSFPSPPPTPPPSQPLTPSTSSPAPTPPQPPPPTLSPTPTLFRPRLFSHHRGSTHITCLTCIPYLSTPLIAAGTSEGFLSLWHPSGECLASSFLLPFHATLLLPFHSLPTYSSSPSYLIACSSHHPYLYLVSVPSLSPVLILGHEKDATGILAATFQTKRTRTRPSPDSASPPTPSHTSPLTPTPIDERPC